MIVSDSKGRKDMGRLGTASRACRTLTDGNIPKGKQELIAIDARKRYGKQAGK